MDRWGRGTIVVVLAAMVSACNGGGYSQYDRRMSEERRVCLAKSFEEYSPGCRTIGTGGRRTNGLPSHCREQLAFYVETKNSCGRASYSSTYSYDYGATTVYDDGWSDDRYRRWHDHRDRHDRYDRWPSSDESYTRRDIRTYEPAARSEPTSRQDFNDSKVTESPREERSFTPVERSSPSPVFHSSPSPSSAPSEPTSHMRSSEELPRQTDTQSSSPQPRSEFVPVQRATP